MNKKVLTTYEKFLAKLTSKQAKQFSKERKEFFISEMILAITPAPFSKGAMEKNHKCAMPAFSNLSNPGLLNQVRNWSRFLLSKSDENC